MDSVNESFNKLAKFISTNPNPQTGANLLRELYDKMNKTIADLHNKQHTLETVSNQLVEIRSLVDHKQLQILIEKALDSRKPKQETRVHFDNQFDDLFSFLPPGNKRHGDDIPSTSKVQIMDLTKPTPMSVGVPPKPNAQTKRELLFDIATRGLPQFQPIRQLLVGRSHSQQSVGSVLNSISVPVDFAWCDIEPKLITVVGFEAKLEAAKKIFDSSTQDPAQAASSMLYVLSSRLGNL